MNWRTISRGLCFVVLAVSGFGLVSCATLGGEKMMTKKREYNGAYSGRGLNRVAFPLGGIGAGMVCLEGSGAIYNVSVRNRMDFFNEPCTFAALCVKGEENVARVLEGPIPDWKYFGGPGTGNGAVGTPYGLPRFSRASFLARFPFATLEMADEDIPLNVSVTGWSPFVPGDADSSSLPVGALEYRFKNPTGEAVEAVFSFNTKNFMAKGSTGNTILPIRGGFILWQDGPKDEATDSVNEGAFAVFVDDPDVVVDHCWFKGGWWDSLTLAWRNVQEGRLLNNPPVEGPCPGASLFVPIRLNPGEAKTLCLQFAWYVPNSDLRLGSGVGSAFGSAPSKGTASGQSPVTGFLGEGLVNTFDPDGDGATGTLTSPVFSIEAKYIHFLIGGGHHPESLCINLEIAGEVVRSSTGRNSEQLMWETWEVSEFRGKQARIQIVDQATESWGHINIDHIVMSDKSIEQLRRGMLEDDNAIADDPAVIVLQDFESSDYGDWVVEGPASLTTCQGACDSSLRVCDRSTPSKYFAPWYAGRFKSLEAVADYWRDQYHSLRDKSARFRDCFYDTTLPAEVVEAVAANLTILKSPTVLRQTDGRLWCFEGCCDEYGCCHGSCTHVWNYAQALPHLFPDLERTLRETEFFVSQDERGHQTFRSCLPIRPVTHDFHAASDGQLGGILKVYREWRISADTDWLRTLWPKVRQSLEYCIQTWDPRGRGVLEEPHHNTYDIEYWGPDSHCSSFYLGALTAMVRMGSALGEDVSPYRRLLEKGKRYYASELYNGEYFYQKITTEGLDATFEPLDVSDNGEGYQDIVDRLNRQGPKYQYGTGCLSDGVLGFWMSRMCGLDEEIVSHEKIGSHLKAVHRYNLRHDLSTHANPQRPSFAMGDDGGLLLCTWPRGGALSIPFVYSDEVWTGIEYQVASHLMLEGMVEEGLEIVRLCRDRYDGVRRNPFNEYECGHWYARALSSYGLLQGLTGVRYDAVDKILYIDSKIGNNFRSFLCTETGFGTIGLKQGKPFVEVKHGDIDIRSVVVSGEEVCFSG